MNLDTFDRVDHRQPGVVRGKNSDLQPGSLFCVGEVKKEWRDVIPRITRERRGEVKHAHADSVTAWARLSVDRPSGSSRVAGDKTPANAAPARDQSL